jgi:hypothetical protein
MSEASALPVLALHRYWIWADFHKEVMLDHLSGESPDSAHPMLALGREFDAAAALGFFYASLYVVIEGWHELKLDDDEIDGLIASGNTDLLRRFRNGIFHFQHDFDDDRFLGFLNDAHEPVGWARRLHSAFARWFRRWAHDSVGFGPDDVEAWLRVELDAFESRAPSRPEDD